MVDKTRQDDRSNASSRSMPSVTIFAQEDNARRHHSIPCCCLRRSKFSCLSARSSFERAIFSGW